MTAIAGLVAFAAAWGVGGLLLGVAYFAMVSRSAALIAAGRGRWGSAALTLGRLAGATLFFAGAARYGALPLLGAFAGFLCARGVALHVSPRVA